MLCWPRRWLLLEFCNRGCISDAVEKGWFRQQPAVVLGDAAAAGADSSACSSSFTGGPSSPAPDLAAILATAREVAAAMSYLHHKNMLHGDLTGNNVLLTAAPAERRGYTAKVRGGRAGPVLDTVAGGTCGGCGAIHANACRGLVHTLLQSCLDWLGGLAVSGRWAGHGSNKAMWPPA